MTGTNLLRIVVADDDPDDRMMVCEAIEEGGIGNPVDTVCDGEELLEYLECRGRFTDRSHELPGLILLDLNMPRMDGREALAAIKASPMLRRIPVVALTTSKAEEDLVRTYDLGANSFCIKPVTFEALVELMRDLDRYWFSVVALAR